MFEHILVPTDFSDENRRALNIAVNIVSRGHGKISLLHVIQTIAHTTFEEFEGFYKNLEKKARNSIDALIDDYHGRDVAIEPTIVYGERVERILSMATEHQVDLILMNSHRIRPEDPIHGWGTISYKVAVLSQCPVMLVK